MRKRITYGAVGPLSDGVAKLVGAARTKKIFWSSMPPIECDICRKPIREVFVDGNTRWGWGRLDLRCHRAHGFGLGTGKGQLYRKQQDGSWLKEEG